MDYIKSFTGSDNRNQSSTEKPPQTQGEGSGGLMGRLNNAMGGGQAGEAKEDKLDKGIDYIQEHVLGQGPQGNESAVEQQKDEMISDAIRRQYKTATGKEFFVEDK